MSGSGKPTRVSLAAILGFGVAMVGAPEMASAADSVTVVAPHRGAWDTYLMILAQEQGYFRKEGLCQTPANINESMACQAHLMTLCTTAVALCGPIG